MKEHGFVNHSEEYAKDDVHVNIHHSVPDGLGGERIGLPKEKVCPYPYRGFHRFIPATLSKSESFEVRSTIPRFFIIAI